MSQQSKNQYVELLAKELSVYYNMTYAKALDVVNKSFVVILLELLLFLFYLLIHSNIFDDFVDIPKVFVIQYCGYGF